MSDGIENLDKLVLQKLVKANPELSMSNLYVACKIEIDKDFSGATTYMRISLRDRIFLFFSKEILYFYMTPIELAERGVCDIAKEIVQTITEKSPKYKTYIGKKKILKAVSNINEEIGK